MDIFSSTGQNMTLVLAALFDSQRTMSKRQTIAYIEDKGWFDLQPEDRVSYETHQYEQRWHTQIAFGRQVAFDRKYVADYERDNWEITAKGKERLQRLRDKLKTDITNLGRGYLWSKSFKKWMCPQYEPSDKDLLRPSEIPCEYLP